MTMERYIRAIIGSFILALTLLLPCRAADSPATFLTPRAVVWLGRSQLIPFQLPQAAAADQTLHAIAAAPGTVEVIREPAILAGEKIGYVRVRGLQVGKTTLTIDKASLDITVQAAPPTCEIVDPRPQIVSPAQGAAVWGKIGVGVEIFGDAAPASIQLRLPSGKLLDPASRITIETAPMRKYIFEIDTQDIAAGETEFVAVAKSSDGGELQSAPLHLSILKPAAADIVVDECENHLEPVRRNQGKNPAQLHLGSDPVASGGRYVVCASEEPSWGFDFENAKPGLYRIIVTARGDFAGGAMPTLGVCMGSTDRAVTTSRLADPRWRRVPVGIPFRLDAGKHVFAVRFLNDFYAPDYGDRNVYLDRYEIVRVETGKAKAHGDAMAGGSGGMMAMGSGYGSDTGDVRIAFNRPLHNLPLRGDLHIQGGCWWRDPKNVAPPVVDLLINGKVVMSQRAGDPTFRVNPGYFREGVNVIQMNARLDGGETGSTPPQGLRVTRNAVEGIGPRAYYRYGVEDAAWNGTLKDLLTNAQRPEGQHVAEFAGNGQAVLTLPEDLAGNFEVCLDNRGEQYQGPPLATVTLKAADGEKLIAEYKVSQYWNDAIVGKVELAKGPKQLVVAFTNDLYKEKEGDRNLWIKSLSLRAPPATEDHTPPVVKLLYPAEGHVAYMADAVVAEVSDDDAPAWIDLAIDGRLRGERLDYDINAGHVVLPLLCRSLTPGTHHLVVRTADRAGNEAESQEISFTVLEKPPAEPGQYERAVRLLDRFAFGPDTEELAGVLTMGEDAYLQDRLSRPMDEPGERAASGRGPVVMPRVEGYDEIALRVIEEFQLTPNPVRARFVMWAENHFSTWMRKTEGWRKWSEHQAFSRVGVAPFADLLETSATSPAMLVYLDQRQSFATRLNENYAREIMELHTLGVHGGYSQKDVTTLAGLLNGWTAAEEAPLDGRGYPLASVFRYDPLLNDGQPRRIVGMNFAAAAPGERYNRVRLALELLAAHPSTAEHICRQLAEHYVSDPASETMVKDLTTVFMESGGDMKAVLVAMAKHPEFTKAGVPLRVARPIDYAIRVARATRSDDIWPVNNFLQTSGMGMFDHVSPDGYPENDQKWADSNALLQRWKLAKEMEWRLSTLTPGGWRWQPKPDIAAWRQEIVDMIAVRLTGRVLGETSNEAAMKVLEGAKGNTDAKVMQVASFVGALPEVSLR